MSKLLSIRRDGWIINIDNDSLFSIIIIWGLPAFIVFRGYLKMNTDDRKSAMNDFKSCRFITTTINNKNSKPKF